MSETKNGQLKVRAEKSFWSDSIGVWLYQHRENGAISVSSDLVMQTIDAGQIMPAAPFQLDAIAAQSLVDQLWEAGIRPSQGSGSAGSLAATERHLEDMRSLVFKKGKS